MSDALETARLKAAAVPLDEPNRDVSIGAAALRELVRLADEGARLKQKLEGPAQLGPAGRLTHAGIDRFGDYTATIVFRDAEEGAKAGAMLYAPVVIERSLELPEPANESTADAAPGLGAAGERTP